MTLFLDDGDCQLHHGDVLTVLRTLPAGIAQTCVTSPPFYGLRDYGTGSWMGGDPTCDHTPPVAEIERRYVAASTLEGGCDNQRAAAASLYAGSTCGRCGARRVDDQIGLEPTIHEYVQRIVSVFTEVWRVLRADGSLWLELGDSYTSGGRSDYGPQSGKQQTNAGSLGLSRIPTPTGLKPKDLIGVPWTVAFALRDAGWYLRSDIIWSRPNPMPESVTDRPTKIDLSSAYLEIAARRLAQQSLLSGATP